MKTKNLTILAGLIFLSASIFAQGNYRNQGNFNGQGQGLRYQNNFDGQGQGLRYQGDMFMNIPDLTDDQKTKITDMRAANMKEMLPLRNKLREKQAHLNTISTGDNVNMTDVNKTIGEVGAIKIDMAKKRASQRQEVRKILTDDQRVFVDMRSGRNGNRHGGNNRGGYGGRGMR